MLEVFVLLVMTVASVITFARLNVGKTNGQLEIIRLRKETRGTLREARTMRVDARRLAQERAVVRAERARLERARESLLQAQRELRSAKRR